MIEIELKTKLNDKIIEFINNEFDKYVIKYGEKCDYNEFNFIAKKDNKVIGIISCHSYYDEVQIDDFIVIEKYRRQTIGSQLLQKVEEYCKYNGFKNINVIIYEFLAPEFYKKCGYTLDYVRENKNNKRLNKYFFVKYF